MKSTTFAIAALVIAVVAVGGIALYVSFKPTVPTSSASTPPPAQADTSVAAPSNIVIDESLSDGKYTFSGYLPVTSSCDTLSSSLFVPGGNPSQLVLRLSLLDVGGSNCTQTSGQSQNFSDTFEPSGTSTKVALQSVLFNGTPATFTIQTQ